MNAKQYENFIEESKKINKMEKEEGIAQRDNLLENYLEKATTNSCFLAGLVSQQYQDMCDDRNHSEMSILLGEITKLTHEFEGIEGMVDLLEKIRRVYTNQMQEMIERNEKKEKENV